jgi:adenylyl-sulfate kinase
MAVTAEERQARLGQRALTVWLTGLPGAGKSTLAREAERRLHAAGRLCVVLDGDNLRLGLNRDLGFTPADRAENVRRVAEVARLFNEAGLLALVPLISPFRADRDRARAIVGPERFCEVHVHAPLAACEARDPKGLYRRARAGEIAEFTGVSAPYEPPERPALVLDTATGSVETCVDTLLGLIAPRVAPHASRSPAPRSLPRA